MVAGAALTSALGAHRYQHAVRVCALQEDLSSLPYGDLTEVSRLPGPRAGPAPPTPDAPGGPGSPTTPPPTAASALGDVTPAPPVLASAWPLPGAPSKLPVISGKASGQSRAVTWGAGSALLRTGGPDVAPRLEPQGPFLPHGLCGGTHEGRRRWDAVMGRLLRG